MKKSNAQLPLRTLSYTTLRRAGVSKELLQQFVKVFGDKAEVIPTKELCEFATKDFCWELLAEEFLSPSAKAKYDEFLANDERACINRATDLYTIPSWRSGHRRLVAPAAFAHAFASLLN